jgi:hypothetical protein
LFFNGIKNGLELLGNHREHFEFNSVELIEATPSSARGKTFKEFTHLLVVETVRAVEHDTMTGKSLGKILHSFSFTSTGGSLWSTSILEEKSTTKRTVASVSEWSDN